MIVSAVAVFAIVSGALAFKGTATKAYRCESPAGQEICVLKHTNLDLGGTGFFANAITPDNIAGKKCVDFCPTSVSIEYAPE